MSQNLRGTIWGAARWLGHRRSRSDLPWVIDQRDGERWVELGRHSSKQEADAMVARLVSDGRGEASSFRVLRRPFAADEGAPLLRVMVIGLVVAALLAVVLVLSWR